MSTKSTTSTKKRQLKKRGQAMVEYSAINWAIAMALCFTLSSNVFPGKKNLIELFLEAYQVYYDSYYFVLNLPFP
jgi:hypothetical protein